MAVPYFASHPPTANECPSYHTPIMRQTLSGSARLPVHEGCVCVDRVYRMSLKKERKCVCVECSRESSPSETKGGFLAFLEGPCEAVKLFLELKMYGVFSVSVCFFGVNTAPFWAGQSWSSLFGQRGHMRGQLNPQ